MDSIAVVISSVPTFVNYSVRGQQILLSISYDERHSHLLSYSSIEQAIDTFAQAREPGIYKQDYLNSLQEKFGQQASQTIRAPRRPEWCFSRRSSFVVWLRFLFDRRLVDTQTTMNHSRDNRERPVEERYNVGSIRRIKADFLERII